MTNRTWAQWMAAAAALTIMAGCAGSESDTTSQVRTSEVASVDTVASPEALSGLQFEVHRDPG